MRLPQRATRRNVSEPQDRLTLFPPIGVGIPGGEVSPIALRRLSADSDLGTQDGVVDQRGGAVPMGAPAAADPFTTLLKRFLVSSESGRGGRQLAPTCSAPRRRE
jgi:hypothetical protein